MTVNVARADQLVIGGVSTFSCVDWPGQLAVTVFLQGCPWDCGYCHNPELRDPRREGSVSWAEVRELLDRRRGLLDAVVFSGGEPTRQTALAPAAAEARRMGYAVGLHTAGAYPARLRDLLPHLDWIALDIKAPRATYDGVTRSHGSGARAWESLGIVMASGIPYELRLTVDPVTLDAGGVAEVVAALAERGAAPPVLQESRAHGARPAYVAALAGRTLDDVLPAGAHPGLERRRAVPSG